MTPVLLLKLLLVPSLIGVITLAGRRWGPAVAGWLSAFPVVAAPILFFVALEQGETFAAEAAEGTLSAVPVILVFNLSYARAAARLDWPASLAIGFAAYGCAVWAVNQWAPGLAMAGAAAALALLAAPRLFPAEPVSCGRLATSAASSGGAAGTTSAAPPIDLPWRMLAAAALVLLVTGFSQRLGPRLSGMFAMFPVMASVLAVFSHRQSGAVFAIRLLKGTVLGYYAFTVFCLALSLSLRTWGLWGAFAASLGLTLAVQVITKRYLVDPRA